MHNGFLPELKPWQRESMLFKEYGFSMPKEEIIINRYAQQEGTCHSCCKRLWELEREMKRKKWEDCL